jgi:hypothetical protein
MHGAPRPLLALVIAHVREALYAHTGTPCASRGEGGRAAGYLTPHVCSHRKVRAGERRGCGGKARAVSTQANTARSDSAAEAYWHSEGEA